MACWRGPDVLVGGRRITIQYGPPDPRFPRIEALSGFAHVAAATVDPASGRLTATVEGSGTAPARIRLSHLRPGKSYSLGGRKAPHDTPIETRSLRADAEGRATLELPLSGALILELRESGR
jgi:hypothetical protein